LRMRVRKGFWMVKGFGSSIEPIVSDVF
jgi:hypothetical protein